MAGRPLAERRSRFARFRGRGDRPGGRFLAICRQTRDAGNAGRRRVLRNCVANVRVTKRPKLTGWPLDVRFRWNPTFSLDSPIGKYAVRHLTFADRRAAGVPAGLSVAEPDGSRGGGRIAERADLLVLPPDSRDQSPSRDVPSDRGAPPVDCICKGAVCAVADTPTIEIEEATGWLIASATSGDVSAANLNSTSFDRSIGRSSATSGVALCAY